MSGNIVTLTNKFFRGYRYQSHKMTLVTWCRCKLTMKIKNHREF
jgi:hypothetical protein